MVINGFQIDETEVLDASYEKVFTMRELIIYVIEHADELRKTFGLTPVAAMMFQRRPGKTVVLDCDDLYDEEDES